MHIKNFLKKILPLPANKQRQEFESIKSIIIGQNKSEKLHIELLEKELYKLQEQMDKSDIIKNKNINQLTKDINQLTKDINQLTKDTNQLTKKTEESCRYASEAVWAEIFNNTIRGSNWACHVAYSPGRGAVGYPYLYVMYRILNEVRPKRILELGMGQSTRMLGEYAATHEDIEHVVVEHDQDWINFFCRGFHLSSNSQVVCLERELATYKEANAVRVFKGFKEKFKGRKFDFISIDAPLGMDMKKYSRIDVLQLLPDILSDNFVIMIDDTDRQQEKNTVREMVEILRNSGIPFKVREYSGKKDFTLICAGNLGFLTIL